MSKEQKETDSKSAMKARVLFIFTQHSKYSHLKNL
jgi:hypothetical protein